jgi:predicted site-specific integrase-resolvase
VETLRGCIQDASKITGVPSGTIRRWLSEGRLARHGDHKPWRVDYDEIMALRALLKGDEG